MNQLDATMIYWSIRSAQHVSGSILPIIRSVRLRYLQHMVSCCCAGQGDGEQQRGTTCTVHIVPSCCAPSPCPPQQQDTICCKYLSLTVLMMGKILPETCWADLVINKSLLHLVGSSALLYLIDDARSNKNQVSIGSIPPSWHQRSWCCLRQAGHTLT